MDRLLGTVISRAFRRGIRGEPLWLVVGAGAWLVRRARQQPPKTIWSAKVSAGDRLLVHVFDPRSRGHPASTAE